MRIRNLTMGLLMSGVGFAAAAAKTTASPDLVSRISSGFQGIISGDLGLQLAVVIIFVVGFAVGWWKEAHGGF